jgi:hypothetical protein
MANMRNATLSFPAIRETQGGVCRARGAKRLQTPDSVPKKHKNSLEKNQKMSCNIFIRVIY